MKKIEIKRTEDLEIERGNGVRANVRMVGYHSSDFEYGYRGSGPTELGLSALNAFVPDGADGEVAMDLGDRAEVRIVSQFAFQFAGQFADEVLGHLPREPGRYIVKAADVRQWVQARLTEQVTREAGRAATEDEEVAPEPPDRSR